MILEIRLENFFSIKDEVVLDFRAAKVNSASSRALSANVSECNGKQILKGIGLFGANASGKSNILKAVQFCRRIILDSHLYNEGISFAFMPFKFDGRPNKPSKFSIIFIYDTIEYEYSFTLTRNEIINEELYYYPNRRKAKIFIRDENKGSRKSQIYNFSDGIIPRPFDIAASTSKKSLFLSRASQMDREICRKLYKFFLEDFLVGFVPLDIQETTRLFSQYKHIILYALSICDSDISDVAIIHEKAKLPQIPRHMQLPPFPQEQEVDIVKFETYHSLSPSTPFDLMSEESAGTQQLFAVLFLLIDVIRNGKMLILDEFDQSLHVKLADFIIDLFNAGSTAQFLFTSHNASLINTKRFRRDQILFTNKKNDGSTELYSLYEYKDFRENMDAEKGYLQGRFDAVPFIDTSFSSLRKLLFNTNYSVSADKYEEKI